MKNSQTETLVEEVVDIDEVTPCILTVYNDDVNTFQWVIQALVEVCKHTLEQAEQCTYMVHYRGKCEVKVGFFKELNPMKQAISERGIKATIRK